MFRSKRPIILTVCLYLVFGFSWILGTDYLLERSFPDPEAFAGWQSVKGLAFILTSAIFFFLALRSTAAKVSVDASLGVTEGCEHSDPSDSPRKTTGRLWVPVGLFVVTIFVLMVAGVAVYRQIYIAMRADAWSDLRNVAGLKALQVNDWRRERFGDVATITGDKNFMQTLQVWLERGENSGVVPDRIIRRMEAIRKGYGYHALLICDTSGTLRYSASEHPSPIPAEPVLNKVLRERRPAFSSFHVPLEGGPQVVDFVVPLANAEGGREKIFGALVFRMPIENGLFPDLQWWSGSFRSSETLVIQNAGNVSPVVISFRHDGGMKHVVTQGDKIGGLRSFLLQVKQEHVSETLDYRGVPVLAVLEPVPDADWLLVTKVDRDEVYRPLRRLGMASGLAVLFLTGVSALGIGLWWRQQQAGFAVAQLRGQLQRQSLRQQLEYLTRFANDSILLLDGQGKIVEANERALKTYGYSRQELLGMNIRALRAPETLKDFDTLWEKSYDQGVLFETRHRRADGSFFPVEVSARRVETGDRVWCQSIIRDITERKLHEEKIQSLTRLYNVLSHTNQAIVRHRDQQSLFDDICRVAVQIGGLRMAVITAIAPDPGQFSPVANHGADPDFLSTINRRSLEGIGGHGPTLKVVKSKQPFICNDIEGDAALQPCLDLAERFGFRSVALFPLTRGGTIFGTLNLYAMEKHFFDPDLTAVLEEMASDITFALDTFDKERARIKVEERLRETSETLTAVFKATPLPVVINDLKGRVILWNPAAEQVFGWRQEELIGKVLPTVPDDRGDEFFALVERVKNGELLREIEVRRLRRDGTLLDMMLFASPLYDGNGQVDRIVALFMDISEQKKAREHIVCLAHYDQLTGLGNRTLLRDRFAQETSRARREGRNLALCLIDLDKFKTVNDALGHSLGDNLLVQVARRLEETVRGADIVCRPGGDEFLILLTDLEEPQDVGKIAQKILQKLEIPFSLEGHTVRMSASMGIGIFPEDGQDLDTLFRNADTAMYAAKEKGRNNFMFFRGEMDRRIRDRLSLENTLRSAFEKKEFFLYYQPQVETESGRITGAEALLRYRHPVEGMIPPDRIIPIAEDSGLIVGIGEWILEEACRRIQDWQMKGLKGLTMAVNLSPVQIFQENFADRARTIMEAHRISPTFLNLELTENIFMEEDQRVRKTLMALKKLGVKISLDDFGTGYSSLSYLKRYAVDEIKIDRTFVKDLCNDPGDAAIVVATIQMAHSLGLQVVAEGVETADQLTFLQNRGCDKYQGYLCSPPLPADDFLSFVESRSSWSFTFD